ncbi:MAG: ABC transporter ATP-binding protein [Candidatus Zixiibacteriota bacterium]
MELQINEVSKLYKGNVWGLKDFSLNINSGVLGLLGPNGAGKSTLMRILATITKPSGGSISWNGSDLVKSPNRVRQVLGYLPQDFGLYPNLNAVEFLSYLASARGLCGRPARQRIDQLLEIVNLSDAKKRRLGSLSGGMKQRVGIAQALLNDPQLLIVDEPTAGLDPEERVRFRNLLSELAGDRIVILSTHIVSDIEAAATSIALINKGRLLSHTSPEDLLKQVENKAWEVTIASERLPDLKRNHVVGNVVKTSEGVRARVVADRAPLDNARNVTATLEDAFLYLLNRARANPDK